MLGKKGFTLIELLVVIGIIAILAAIVIVAVNPSRQFAQSRNAARNSDVQAVLDATHQYAADNDGDLPSDNSGDPIATCETGTTAASSMSDALVPTYISEVPTDPSDSSDYTVCQDAEGRITVAAPNAELDETIEVER